MDETPTNQILRGDSLDILDDLPANSVHAIVTDPPYGLAFMGRDWDDFEPKEYQEWCENWSRRAKRVLKPGGHLLAFSGNRTHHRLFTGVEDAGFEIRDTVTWHYGSGFPKASDVSKTIDKRAGEYENREVTGSYKHPDGGTRNSTGGELGDDEVYGEYEGIDWERPIEEPATDEAKEWDGWKTGLKPATEFVVMARKPFDGATVDSVLDHGTGALNISECRVPITDAGGDGNWGSTSDNHDGDAWNDETTGLSGGIESSMNDQGRYPSNVVFDAAAARQLDSQSGDLDAPSSNSRPNNTGMFDPGVGEAQQPYDDGGGASRFFYTSKASKAERTLDGKIENAHPTVKPTDLMEWLVKLVSAEGQLVLDPFAGSGTTCAAAKTLGRGFIGIEKQAKWADVARVRCGLTPSDPANVRADDSQSGLEAFADGGFIE